MRKMSCVPIVSGISVWIDVGSNGAVATLAAAPITPAAHVGMIIAAAVCATGPGSVSAANATTGTQVTSPSAMPGATRWRVRRSPGMTG